MKKKLCVVAMSIMMTMALFAGCGDKEDSNSATGNEGQVESDNDASDNEATDININDADENASDENASDEEIVNLETATVTVFAAKSLNTVMEELIGIFSQKNPAVTVVGSYDSSGTLMNQIEEGASCDVFFSAAQTQMNTLEEDGFLVDGTRHNVVNNQVCVVTYKGSNTSVTGLADIANAESLALADGSVPVGKYTRQAMVNAGMLEAADDVASISTETVSEVLGGITINECANVGAVAAAVSEGSNEVGTVYYSDTYGFEDTLEILEYVPYDLTGNVIYPVAQVVNSEADDAENAAAQAFVEFLTSDEAKEVFQKYYFDTNIED
jgi:molybdate transport system substrate-binding protein